MIELKICVGSACHLKGSTEVIDIFQNCIRKKDLTNKVEKLKLKQLFALGTAQKQFLFLLMIQYIQ